LSALTVAVHRSPQNLQIYGKDDASTDFLTEGVHSLTQQRRFPPATESVSRLSWAVRLEAQIRERRPFGRHATRTVMREFGIDLLDVPGESYGSGYGRGSDGPSLADDLAACQGFILLFDSVRESQRGDSLAFFEQILMKLAQRSMAAQRFRGERGMLPHYLAVCATKFDEPDIYTKARERGFVSPGQEGQRIFPRVSDDQAEEFIRYLSRGSSSGNMDLLFRIIRLYFRPERVRYFVTSSIGFYLDRATGVFDEKDFRNVDQMEDGQQQIRGPIYPINVVEPVLWIGESIAEASS
jgi:hypothetical protein